MCLSEITKIHKFPNRKKVVGWKVVRKGFKEQGYYSEFDLGMDFGKIHIGKWKHRNNPDSTISADDPEDYYPAGIHIFASRQLAIQWCDGKPYDRIVKVEGQGLLVEGKQIWSSGPACNHEVVTYVCNKYRITKVDYKATKQARDLDYT